MQATTVGPIIAAQRRNELAASPRRPSGKTGTSRTVPAYTESWRTLALSSAGDGDRNATSLVSNRAHPDLTQYCVDLGESSGGISRACSSSVENIG